MSGIIEVATSPVIYLDTNVFIRGIEGNDVEATAVQKLFYTLRDFPNASATSELTLAELLAPAARPEALHLNQKEPLYLDLIVSGGFIALYPITRDILISTAHLRLTHPQKLADAIHIVTAFEANCRYFMSHDKDGTRLPVGLQHLLPNETGVRMVLDTLRA
jgi:predicted nucleic acid-binding protein